ncbi:ABC transporter [Ceratobasidium sp. AG-Ba]|nr:ABC transporter [Ceratobasidium sp. AG-Ba]
MSGVGSFHSAFAVFFGYASEFLSRPNNLGFGSAVPIVSLADTWKTDTIYYVDATGANPSRVPSFISTLVSSSNLSPGQQSRLKPLESRDAIQRACPSNFNLVSECFAVLVFDYLPSGRDDSRPMNYTMRIDGGRTAVDVEKHTSDFERVTLPVQWAVDKAVMQLLGATNVPTPREWPYTQESNEEAKLNRRLSYLDVIEDLLVFVLFFAFLGVVYQLSGAFVDERASRLASLMHVMGCGRAARMVSWHASVSLVYLPAWIFTALIWHFRIFSKTNAGLLVAIHIITGLSLASFSLLACMPFRKSPQLGAIATTFLTVLLSIIALLVPRNPTACAMYTLIFPPGFFVFAIKAVSRFEQNLHGAQVGTSRGQAVAGVDGGWDGRILGSCLGVAVANIFLWLLIAGIVERWMFEPGAGDRNVAATNEQRSWFSRLFGLRSNSAPGPPQEDEDEPHTPVMTGKSHPIPPAITLTNLTKTFPPAKRRAPRITAVKNLSLSIPARGIFVLLGANGSGKSTTLEMVAGLTRPSAGGIEFGDELEVDEKDQVEEKEREPRRGGKHGSLGLVPQRNVLFPELTCYQTVRLWRDIKVPHASRSPSSTIPLETSFEALEQLLVDCDLGPKMHSSAATLSGGQKRRLQLACGLVGGSKIVLVDEATSGVDPLSRRAIWRALGKVREDRCVVFTTHFLDEADLLADDIAILAAPGKLLAQGSPVALKSKLGQGYVVHVPEPSDSTLSTIRTHAPLATTDDSEPGAYILHSKSPQVVGRVLDALEKTGVQGYDVRNTSMEAIFLDLMGHGKDGADEVPERDELAAVQSRTSAVRRAEAEQRPLALSDGRKTSSLRQALTGFHKRSLILRRSWLSYVLMVIIAIAGACVPLIFMKDRADTCQYVEDIEFSTPLYLPAAGASIPSTFGDAFDGYKPIISPPDLLAPLDATQLPQTAVSGSEAFAQTLRNTYRNLSIGGLEVDGSQQATVAWEASPGSVAGLALLNLASNVLADRVLGTTGPRIIAYFQNLPGSWVAGTGMALKWEGFFGASMGLWPAFFILYVSAERRSSVQAMQLSNGMTPAGLWLGHLLFDLPWVVLIATIITIVFGVATSQFYALGALWAVMVLYGIAGALFAYVISTFVKSPLAGFAVAGGYNVIMSVLYTAAYMLTLTYTRSSDSSKTLMVVHYTISLVSPVASVVRAAFVSVNLFSILCDGLGNYSPTSPSSMGKFGGPVVYLIGWILVLFGLLMWIEYGKPIPKWLRFWRNTTAQENDAERTAAQNGAFSAQVKAEAKRVQNSQDALRVLNVTKTFPGRFTAVDDVSFGVDNETFAMLGPNGAGKTTTFNIIRGDVRPTNGDVLISGVSIVDELAAARVSLGVTPQFSAADSQLTVREHMMIYGSLKGLRGENLRENVELLMEATALSQYRDRLASKLSGGNARKLSLALSLIGNPRVLLIDEYSTGIDAATKRAMWKTLRRVSSGKAVVITTHSMEEASALASKVGILSKRMLAVGTTHELVSHFPTYEVHFTARTPYEASRAAGLMSRFPGSRKADDVATRYEVPIGETSLASLFNVLSGNNDNDQSISEDSSDMEYTVERLGLESVFLKVIREHDAAVGEPPKVKPWWRFW